MLRLVTPARFRIALAIVLGLVFAALQFTAQTSTAPATLPAWQQDGRLHVFFHPDCPHCHQAIEFLKAQTGIDYDLHDVATPANEALLLAVAYEFGIPQADLGVPLFVRGSRYLIGFGSAETTGRDLLALASDESAIARSDTKSSRIQLPLLGEIEPSEYSLLALTALMGLSDGFNPCAMWVLVYLISLIASIQDRRKIWWLVGTFVLASGILYFLFMTAWLNTFLVIGYIRPLTQFIALLAIGFGTDHLFELALKRGIIVCELGDTARRRRTMQWARGIVAAPIGLGSLVLVIGLAFTVNAIEWITGGERLFKGFIKKLVEVFLLSRGKFRAFLSGRQLLGSSSHGHLHAAPPWIWFKRRDRFPAPLRRLLPLRWPIGTRQRIARFDEYQPPQQSSPEVF